MRCFLQKHHHSISCSFPTCSQDVSCHPECGQSADHRSSPQPGHELGEIGENDRYGSSDPAEEKKNSFKNRHFNKSSSGLRPTNKFFEQAPFSPDATDEPQQQEDREHSSQAGQTSKHPVDCQRHYQDFAAPPLVS